MKLGGASALRGGLSIGRDTRAAMRLLKGPRDGFDFLLPGLNARGWISAPSGIVIQQIRSTHLVVEILCPPFRHELLL